jgi:integrase/recombinase XerD
MKIKEALELYLAVDRAKATRNTYSKFLSRFINTLGPERPLDLIRPEDVDVFIQEMRFRDVKYADHPSRPIEREPLSTATVYRNIKMIKTFFKWCVDRGFLAVSPASHIHNPKPRRPLGQGKAATDHELDRMLEASRYQPRNYALVMLLAQSGCRAGEAASLRIRDLNWQEHKALVYEKGGGRRWIFFDEETCEALRVWLRRRPRGETNHVFVSEKGIPISAEAVSQVVRRLCKSAGLKRSLGAHSLRHRVGLTFARQHVAPRVTQAYLGHRDITITLSYYQDVDESDLLNAGELLKNRS